MSRWIEYVATQHKCHCLRCGHLFIVDVGNMYSPDKNTPEPHRILLTCPSCELRSQLQHPDFTTLGINNAAHARAEVKVYSPENCSCGQVAMSSVTAELREHKKQLITIKLICQKILSDWKTDWGGAVMPFQMNTLKSTLDQLEDDIQ